MARLGKIVPQAYPRDDDGLLDITSLVPHEGKLSEEQIE